MAATRTRKQRRKKPRDRQPDLSGGWWNEETAQKTLAAAPKPGPKKTPRKPRPKTRRKIPLLAYAQRNEVLAGMGFVTYAAYLKSPLWGEIRQRVFATKGRRCWICRRRKVGRQVHHEYYTEANLTGEKLGGLRPTCRSCHLLVEFTAGEKLTTRQSRKKSAALRRRSTKTKKRVSRGMAATLRRAEREGHDIDAEIDRLCARDG